MSAQTLSNYGNLNKWHAAIARVKGATGRGLLVINSDSTGTGAGAGTGGTGNMTGAYPRAWPARMASTLSNDYHIPINDNSLWASALSPVSYPTYDTRVALGSHTLGLPTLGGALFTVANNQVSTFSFTPLLAFDRIELYYRKSFLNGTQTINVDGGASLGTIDFSSPGADTLAKNTYNVTLGTHTINIIHGATQTCTFAGIKVYNSAVPAIDLIRASAYGTGIVANSGSVTPYDAVPMITFLAADMLVSGFTINDSNTPLALATYQTAYQTQITAQKAVGDMLLMTGPPSNTAAATSPTGLVRYTDVLEALASSNSLPFLRLGGTRQPSRWGSYNNILNQFPYFDTLHPNQLAYWDIGAAVAQVLAVR